LCPEISSGFHALLEVSNAYQEPPNSKNNVNDKVGIVSVV